MESFDVTIVSRILRLRVSPQARSALRRAAIPATESAAYSYLSWVWTSEHTRFRKQPTLALASLAANHAELKQMSGVSLGLMARRLVAEGMMSAQGVETRLALCQTQSLSAMLRVIRPLFGPAERAGVGIDFFDLYRTLSRWDHPNAEARLRTRRRVLEDFFVEDPSAASVDAAPDGEPAVLEETHVR